MNDMGLQTAIEILEYHQEWRQGKREDMPYEPQALTEALDVVLSEVKKLYDECKCIRFIGGNTWYPNGCKIHPNG